MTQRVYITDVAPRDGLQNEPRIIPTADKVRLVRLLDPSGVDEIEVTSFVSPRWVPQLGDAADVFAALAATKPPGVAYSALVPNEKGMEAALRANAAAQATLDATGGARRLIDRVSVFTAASETFSQKNTNATIAETLDRFRPVLALARANGLSVRAYVSTAIRCPFEGDVAPAAVADLAQRLFALGVDDVDLADTIGAATPESLRAMLTTAIERVGPSRLSLHLHDTFGQAAACIPVALALGLRSFDGAAGGLGGCPYAATPPRRAPGNVATEGLVRAIHAAGFTTGVNLDRLDEAARFARFLTAPIIA